MALLYPWATKEYLLWNCSIGQIIMYHNLGIEVKYGKNEESGSLLDKPYEEVKAIRDDMVKNGLLEKESLREKYGEIE